MLFPIRRIMGYVLLVMVALAIWRGSGEDASVVAENGWGFIDAGANILADVWRTATD